MLQILHIAMHCLITKVIGNSFGQSLAWYAPAAKAKFGPFSNRLSTLKIVACSATCAQQVLKNKL